MAAYDNVQKSGTSRGNTDIAGNAVLIPHPVIGVVKDNIDPTKMGRIRVYISRFGGIDPNDSSNWRTVKYLSPWFGTVGQKGSNTGFGSYVGNPQSYGFWATAPDIGSQVICVFINGDPEDGYYIGCVPAPGLNHMVPAIGANKIVVPNDKEATSYGGADRLPVTEINSNDPKLRNSPTVYSEPKPLHSYQAAVLAAQGLIRDNIRGVISSSAQRETPSHVFGFSTPGQAIYQGGYTAATLAEAAKSADEAGLQVIGRTGGHSIVLDDGDISGQDQLMRLRTSAGHMIMMNDSGSVLTIMHANGRSYVELGKEGTVDVYSSNSINLRTEGDFNIHADRDVNIHAKRNLSMFGNKIQEQAATDIEQRAGNSFAVYANINYSVSALASMTLSSLGPAGFSSKISTFISGKPIFLNTGFTPFSAKTITEYSYTQHVDTTYSQNKGWMNPSPDPVLSIASRVPAHMPWAAANKGVDVRTGNAQPATPAQPSAAITAVNTAAGDTPNNPTNASLMATVPNSATASQDPTAPALTSGTVAALQSAQAASAANLDSQARRALGIAPGTPAATYNQLAGPGMVLKPGAAGQVNALLGRLGNLPLGSALPPNLLTGNNGVKDVNTLITNTNAQLNAVTESYTSANTALARAGITNKNDSPNSVGGAILAVANVGLDTFKQIINAPAQAAERIKNLISSGNFAAKLQDAMSWQGLTTSLTGLATSLFGGIGKAFKSIVGAAKAAFAAAEQSFRNLKPNQPNTLGGVTLVDKPASSTAMELIDRILVAEQELIQAQQELLELRRDYREDPSSENRTMVITKEGVVSGIERKIAQLKASAAQQGNNFAGITQISAQNATALATATASGATSVATTDNAGINAIPGGIRAFANEVTGKVGSLVNSVSSLARSATQTVTGFVQTGNLVGNLVQNTQRLLGSVQNSALAQNISGTLSNITNSALVGNAKEFFSGVGGSVLSVLGAFGGGGVKQATLASNTSRIEPAILSTSAQLVGDPRVPVPGSTGTDKVYTATVDEIQRQQTYIINQITEFNAERKVLELKLETLIAQQNNNPNVSLENSIDNISREIADIDASIVVAQENLETWLKTQAA